MEKVSKKTITVAKALWLEDMRRLYPEFKKRLWGKTGYRNKHPQNFA